MKGSKKMRDMEQEAHANLEALGRNPYPGRGIVVGLDQTGQYLVQVYWIMGRSENSRNRVFGRDGGRLFTEAADPAKVTDPSLIIYNAMDEYEGRRFVVSNGHQTDTVIERMAVVRQNFFDALGEWEYEPDDPNFTPRITAVCYLARMPGRYHIAEMCILRKSSLGLKCDRNLYQFSYLSEGIGFCMTTYSGDSNPLPSFRGEPYPLPLIGNAENIGEHLWDTLNTENRVALAVKFIDAHSGRSDIWIKNRFSKTS